MSELLMYVSNRRCPKCGKWGFVRYLDGSKYFTAKCTNCNHYIAKDELSLVALDKNSEPQTNSDRIRAMSDEELAEWLVMVGQRIIEINPMLERPALYADWLNWLKAPVEEGDNGT